MARKYTPEQHEWIREHYPHHPNRELAEMWPWPDVPFTRRMAQAYGANHHLRKLDRGRAMRKYTDEQLAWLRGFIPGHEEREIADAYEERFGERLSTAMVANLKTKLGVRSGTHGGCYKPGHVPANKSRPWSEWMPPESQDACRRTQYRRGNCTGAALERRRDLLDVREGKDGYLQIKVAPRVRRNMNHYNGNWIPLAEFVWMQANGRDWPDGHRAVFADRDTRNLSPDNIVPVPEDVYAIVTAGAHGAAIPYHDRETLELAITHARLIRKRRQLERDAPRTCAVCGKTFRLTDKEKRYPSPPRTCRQCRAERRRGMDGGHAGAIRRRVREDTRGTGEVGRE